MSGQAATQLERFASLEAWSLIQPQVESVPPECKPCSQSTPELQGASRSPWQDGLPADGPPALRLLRRPHANHGRQRAAILSLRRQLSRDAGRELSERSARLERTEERVRGLITMQADGDRSPMVARMRGDLEVQAEQERAAMADLRALATGPIRLPPVDLLTERVFQLRALTESSDVQGARSALRTYFKGGTITMTPEPLGDGQAYVSPAEFLPLVLLNQNAGTPSEPEPGGRCLRWVARGGFEPPTFGL
jgi:hypothetical protein